MTWLRGKLFLLKMYLTKPHTLQVRYVRKGVKHLVIIERKPFGMEIVGRYTVFNRYCNDPDYLDSIIPFDGEILDG